MLHPDANELPEHWARVAPSIISYAGQKTDNLTVHALLTELYSGGQGQCTADGYKPPLCL